MVSLIIAAYNSEKYLEDAILSVLSQTYKDYELIIVDDGSFRGNVAAICNKYKNSLKYIRQENRGVSAARNTGIVNSHGQYLAFLDHDDLWLPEKIEKQINYYEGLKGSGRNVGLVYTGLQYITDTGKEMNKVLYKSSGYNYKPLSFIDFIGTPSSVFVERSVLDNVGLFDEELKLCEDWELWLRVAKKYEIHSLNEFLTRHRNTLGSGSKDPDGMIKDLLLVIEKALKLEPDYTKIKAYHKKDFANRWKVSAYECLFTNKDGENFRRYMQNGFKYDKSIFSFKASICYILSFFSVNLCIKIEQLIKKKQHEDIIVDISKLNF